MNFLDKIKGSESVKNTPNKESPEEKEGTRLNNIKQDLNFTSKILLNFEKSNTSPDLCRAFSQGFSRIFNANIATVLTQYGKNIERVKSYDTGVSIVTKNNMLINIPLYIPLEDNSGLTIQTAESMGQKLAKTYLESIVKYIQSQDSGGAKHRTIQVATGKITKQTPESLDFHTPTSVLGVRG